MRKNYLQGTPRNSKSRNELGKEFHPESVIVSESKTLHAEKDGGTSTKNDRVHVGNFHFVL